MIHRKLCGHVCSKKKWTLFPHPQRVLQPIEAVEKRLPLRTDKVKKDHKTQEEQDAAEEWFPKAACTLPVTYDIRSCQLTPYLRFKGSGCVDHACCSAVSWLLLRHETGIRVSSGQTPLLWETCGNPTAPHGNPRGIFYFGSIETIPKNPRDQGREGQGDFYRE